MIGITSYGGYIPRLRLDRMSIYQAMGWFAPAIVMVAQGERSFCNWDEDSLTMAVAAAPFGPDDMVAVASPGAGSFLYFEIRRNGVAANPLFYLPKI